MIEKRAMRGRHPGNGGQLIQDTKREIIGQYGHKQVLSPGSIAASWPYAKGWNPNGTTDKYPGRLPVDLARPLIEGMSVLCGHSRPTRRVGRLCPHRVSIR